MNGSGQQGVGAAVLAPEDVAAAKARVEGILHGTALTAGGMAAARAAEIGAGLVGQPGLVGQLSHPALSSTSQMPAEARELARGSAPPAATQTDQQPTRPRTRAARGSGGARVAGNRQAGSTTAAANPTADSNWPSINITLPPDVYDWLKQRAARAEFEPTLSKFVQWELRKMAKRQQAEAAEASAAAQAAATALPH